MKSRVSSLFSSFNAAIKGFLWAISHQRNMRIHIVFVLYVVLFGVLGAISTVQWLAVMLCFAAVLSCEMINTALERLCDVHTSGYDKNIKIIKDLSAGAVLVCAICTVIVGLMIFLSEPVFQRVIYILRNNIYITICGVFSLPCAGVFIFKKV